MDAETSLELVHIIAQRIYENGGTVYFVGGYVMDKLLGRDNKDIEDFVVSVNSEILKG